MNMEELIARMNDTGIQSETLDAVLNSLLSTGNINVRKLVLPTDKKVLSVPQIYAKDNYLISHEVLIFKAIIKKISKAGTEKLINFGIDRNIFSKLIILTDKEIFEWFKNSIVPKNDRNILDAMIYIGHMCSLTDMYSSQRRDIFEEKVQETKYKHKVKYPEKYTKRIYLNLPLNKIAVDFLTLYKLKCIEKGIPSKMKGMGSSGRDEGELDTTILYSNDYYLMDHISILESIIKEKPDLISSFGSPVISGARVLSNNGEYYYTISSGLLDDNTSNGYYNKLYKISFALLCSKYIKTDNKYNILTLCTMKPSELNEYINKLFSMLNQNIKIQMKTDGFFKEIVCQVSSYLRFGDLEHVDVPLYQDEIFRQFVNKDIKPTKSLTSDEQEQYLYHTEELFEMAYQEFLVSKLSNKERVLKYISRIEQIEKGFRKYAVNTVGFVGSDRYKQVVEYIKTIPKIMLFVEDKTKGNGINMVMEKRYYDGIAINLEAVFSKSDTIKTL